MPALAEWFVEISAKGGADANKTIDQTGEKLKEAEERAKRFKLAVATAFTIGSNAMMAFIKMGLTNTEEGDAMTEAFQRLSDSLASVFLPVIEAITAGISFLADTLENMGGVGQSVFMVLTAAAAAFWAYLTGGILPVLIALGILAGVIGKVASGEGDKKKEVTKKSEKAAFEDPAAVFKRIQLSVAGGANPQQEMVAQQKITNQLLGGIGAGVKDIKPPVGN